MESGNTFLIKMEISIHMLINKIMEIGKSGGFKGLVTAMFL